MPAETPIINNEKPRREGLVLHAYWEGDKMEYGQVVGAVPALRSALAAKAGALELDSLAKKAENQGEEPPIAIISGGYFRGPDNPPISKLMADSMERYGTPRELVSQVVNAYSTGEEIDTALKQARENGITSLIDVAFSSHKRRIKKLFGKFRHNFTFRAVEDILRERGTHKFSRDYIKKTTNEDGTVTEVPVHIDHEHNHYDRLLKKLGRSRQGLTYRFMYEPLANLVTTFIDPKKMGEMNRQKRETNDPGYEFFIPKVHIPLPIDIYKLNGKRAESPIFTPFLRTHAKLRGIWHKIHPEPEKVKPASMGMVEIFPAGPVKRTS